MPGVHGGSSLFVYTTGGGGVITFLVSTKGGLCFCEVFRWLLPAPSGRNNELSLIGLWSKQRAEHPYPTQINFEYPGGGAETHVGDLGPWWDQTQTKCSSLQVKKSNLV